MRCNTSVEFASKEGLFASIHWMASSKERRSKTIKVAQKQPAQLPKIKTGTTLVRQTIAHTHLFRFSLSLSIFLSLSLSFSQLCALQFLVDDRPLQSQLLENTLLRELRKALNYRAYFWKASIIMERLSRCQMEVFRVSIEFLN